VESHRLPVVAGRGESLNPKASLIILGEDAASPWGPSSSRWTITSSALPALEVWRRITSCLKARRDAAPEAVQGKLNAAEGGT